MVAYFGKALGLVPAVDVGSVVVHARGGSAAMDDDFVDVRNLAGRDFVGCR